MQENFGVFRRQVELQTGITDQCGKPGFGMINTLAGNPLDRFSQLLALGENAHAFLTKPQYFDTISLTDCIIPHFTALF